MVSSPRTPRGVRANAREERSTCKTDKDHVGALPSGVQHQATRKRPRVARPESVASVLEASPAWLAAVGPFQPLFRFVLDDLGPLSAEELAARELHALARLVELALWAARSVSRLREAAPHMQAILATLTRRAGAAGLDPALRPGRLRRPRGTTTETRPRTTGVVAIQGIDDVKVRKSE